MRNFTYSPHKYELLTIEANSLSIKKGQWFKAELTETVVSVMCQIESVITSAAIIAWYIGALVYTATVVLQVAFIDV